MLDGTYYCVETSWQLRVLAADGIEALVFYWHCCTTVNVMTALDIHWHWVSGGVLNVIYNLVSKLILSSACFTIIKYELS